MNQEFIFPTDLLTNPAYAHMRKFAANLTLSVMKARKSRADFLPLNAGQIAEVHDKIRQYFVLAGVDPDELENVKDRIPQDEAAIIFADALLAPVLEAEPVVQEIMNTPLYQKILQVYPDAETSLRRMVASEGKEAKAVADKLLVQHVDGTVDLDPSIRRKIAKLDERNAPKPVRRPSEVEIAQTVSMLEQKIAGRQEKIEAIRESIDAEGPLHADVIETIEILKLELAEEKELLKLARTLLDPEAQADGEVPAPNLSVSVSAALLREQWDKVAIGADEEPQIAALASEFNFSADVGTTLMKRLNGLREQRAALEETSAKLEAVLELTQAEREKAEILLSQREYAAAQEAAARAAANHSPSASA